MRIRCLVVAGVLLLPGTALAQAGPVIEQTSEDLICQLTRQCERLDSTLATEKKGKQRGFSITRRNKAPAPAAVTDAARVGTERTPRLKPGKSTGRRNPAAPVSATAEARLAADLRVTFVTASAELTEGGEKEALKFVAALRDPRMAGKRFRIEGHTDAVGGAEYNLDLSRRRAEGVVEFLVGQGADRALFEVEGFGFRRPVDPASPYAAANRRVEVVRAD